MLELTCIWDSDGFLCSDMVVVVVQRVGGNAQKQQQQEGAMTSSHYICSPALALIRVGNPTTALTTAVGSYERRAGELVSEIQSQRVFGRTTVYYK